MDFLQIRKTIKETEGRLKAIGDNATTDIASDALNDVMFYGRTKVKQHVKDVFDRPTPRTLNSILYSMATAQKPEAKVFINENRSKTGVSPAQWLTIQEAGGGRKDKRIETWLKDAGVLADDQQVVPVEQDNFGNMRGGQVQKMLSALQAGDPWQWSKDEKKKAGWRVARRADGKPFGIFRMQGVHSKLFLIFTRKHTYQRKFKFREVLQEAWNKKIEGAYAKAWAKHIKKSLAVVK